MTNEYLPRSLGPRELALLESWEADQVRVVTLRDIEAALGGKEGAARAMAHRLTLKGFLSPVGTATYEVQPISTLGIRAPNVAAYLEGLHRRGVAFYVGFDTAAGYYDWYSEAYGRVTIGIPRSTRPAITSPEGTYVRLVHVPPEVLTHGVGRQAWHGAYLPFSTREQTVLDVVAKSQLVDGISGCLGVLAVAAKDRRVDRTLLAKMAAEWTSLRLRKRLGWLTERAGWEWTEDEVRLLRCGWTETHRATLGESHSRGQKGKWDNRWRLLLNVPESELTPPLAVR
jgi:predicted transcriptional regulator of viral defense system